MSDRKITIKSGNEEFTLEVMEEEYQRYYRPWWSQRMLDSAEGRQTNTSKQRDFLNP